jgi:hypothetical protein
MWNKVINYLSENPGAVAAIITAVTIIILVRLKHFINSRKIKESNNTVHRD